MPILLQNLWRPILISRFDAHGDESSGATLLSLESQGRRLATMLLAPLLGLAIDTVRARELGGDLWPIGVIGALVGLIFCLIPATRGGQPDGIR